MYNKNNINRTFLILFSSLLLASFFLSCSKYKDSRVLDKNEFIEVYTDIMIISADMKISHETRKIKIDSIMAKRNITEKDFKTTVEEYNRDVKEWKEVYKEILARFEKLKTNQSAK